MCTRASFQLLIWYLLFLRVDQSNDRTMEGLQPSFGAATKSL